MNLLTHKDKLDHFTYWFTGTKILMCFMPKVYAAGVMLLVGVGKEAYDKISGKGTACWYDLLADCVGILLALTI